MPPDPILPWPLVKRGQKVFPVRSLQLLLRARSHPVAVDGIFGPQTESAVKAFQQSRGIAADGIVGPQTWPKLVVQVKKGSRGDAVRAVQEVMKFHDQSDGEGPGVQIDGIFGRVGVDVAFIGRARETHRRAALGVAGATAERVRRGRRSCTCVAAEPGD
jgi:peptidoglycan hydrolase-like protein with peptidoglycan-binding domain